MIDGILYIIRTGGSWRMMPNDLPSWKTCYHYFRIWAKQGIWEKIQNELRDGARLKAGKKKPRPLRSLTAKAFAQLARINHRWKVASGDRTIFSPPGRAEVALGSQRWPQ